jgi:hypothetical protein
MTSDNSINQLLPLNVYLDEFINLQENIPIIFSKFCGWSFLHVFDSRTTTLVDVYRLIDHRFRGAENDSNTRLYLDLDRDYLVPRERISLRNYFIRNYNISPVYPISTRIVYRLFLDDGHGH